MEIIRLLVDHDGAPQNIADAKAVGPYLHLRPSVTGKQGRKVTCVIRVWTVLRVKVRECGGETVADAAFAFVDMEAIDIAGAWIVPCGQPVDTGGDDDTIMHGIKGNCSGYAGIVSAAVDARDRRGTGAVRMKHNLDHLTYHSMLCRNRS